MPIRDFQNLVLAVREEGGPLDRGRVLLICGSPVEDNFLAAVSDRQLPACLT